MANKVILVGRLGADPETHGSVCKLRIATSERRKDGEQWKDFTEWHSVVCFGKTGENAAKYLTKGRDVYIEGSLRTSKYTDKGGIERYKTEVIADTVTFIGGGNGQKPEATTGEDIPF